jgi:NADH-quinone oxidoreductase subunit A
MPAGTEAGYEVLWPFMVYSALVLIAVAGILVLSWALGERHRAPGRDVPYESGINPTGDARVRYGVHFYPVAVFFMLFDMEAVFLFAWAVAFPALGWAAYIEAGIFIAVLFVGLVHVWSLGGLDWNPRRASATEARRDT